MTRAFVSLRQDGLLYGTVQDGRTYGERNPPAFGRGVFGSTLTKVCEEVGFQFIRLDRIDGKLVFVFRKPWT